MDAIALLTVAFVAMLVLAYWAVRYRLKNYSGPSPTDGAETPLSATKLGGLPDITASLSPAAQRNLRDGFAEVLRPLTKPGIRIRQSLKPTTSHFGGLPPTHPALTWPHRAGRPLTPLARIDLGEIPHALAWLPRSGTLLFFYDTVGQPTGAEPTDREGWAVLFFPQLQGGSDGRREPPNGAPAPLNEVAITFEEVPTLPPPDDEAIRALALSGDEQDEIANYFGGAHQMGGYAAPLQGGFMEFECQLGLEGISRGELAGPDDPRAQQLMASSADWRLLLQMNSDERVGAKFGNSGRLFFWVREGDARRGDFSKVWCVLQSR